MSLQRSFVDFELRQRRSPFENDNPSTLRYKGRRKSKVFAVFMSSLPTPETETPFICASQPWLETECVGEKFYKERDGKQYCLFHYPGNKSGFWEAVNKRLKAQDFNFQGV